MLIRTAVVRDLKIPASLHVFEDAYVKDWITKKGYAVVACYDPFCVHYRPESVWTLRGSIGIISDAIRFGSLKQVLQLTAAYGFYTAYAAFQIFSKKRA